jgi:hypothetical protein
MVIRKNCKKDIRRGRCSLFWHKLCFRCPTHRATPVTWNRFEHYTGADTYVPFFRIVDMAADNAYHLLHDKTSIN